MIENTFNVGLISETLECCDLNDDIQSVSISMSEKGYDCIGVKNESDVIGYAIKEMIQNNRNGISYNKFTKDDLISSNTSLIKVIELLSKRPFVFVLDGTKVDKIVTKADCYKDAVRIYIYNMISNFELLLSILLEYVYREKDWQELITTNRLDSIKNVYQDRVKDNSELTLFDCLMLEDKITLLLKDEQAWKIFELSKNNLKKYFGDLKTIRNSVAHVGNKPVVTNTDMIIEVVTSTFRFSNVLKTHITTSMKLN